MDPYLEFFPSGSYFEGSSFMPFHILLSLTLFVLSKVSCGGPPIWTEVHKKRLDISNHWMGVERVYLALSWARGGSSGADNPELLFPLTGRS